MEFFCVFSVGGSLASYHVQRTGKGYQAMLRTGFTKPEGLPEEVMLTTSDGNWQAHPWNDEVVRNLVHAIESKSG